MASHYLPRPVIRRDPCGHRISCHTFHPLDTWPTCIALLHILLLLLTWLPRPLCAAVVPPARPLSPFALWPGRDSNHVWVLTRTSKEFLEFNVTEAKTARKFALPHEPSSLVGDSRGERFYIGCAGSQPGWCELDATAPQLRLVRTRQLPQPPADLALSRDGQTLWVAYRFLNRVAELDLRTGQERWRATVTREPISITLTPDERHLLIANHLPAGHANVSPISAVLDVVATESGRVTKSIRLPNGATTLRQVRVSPDGRHAAVTHILARYFMPTTQADRGWINSNALTLLDLHTLELVNTVLLDELDRGAANPWAVNWNHDGSLLGITHAGTHELSLIRFPQLLAKLEALPASAPPTPRPDSYRGARWQGEVPNDLAFLVGLRDRVKLNGNGPRALVFLGNRAYIAHHYSDSLDTVDLNQPTKTIASVPFGLSVQPSQLRLGETWFNDASLCYQGWQSCASCHSDDARVDGLNWDLLNDGLGNPKNTRSLLWSHRTPPAMSLGVRDTAEVAVRAGLNKILFSVQPEAVPQAIDAWLKSLQPAPSPFLVNGTLSSAARRGKRIYQSRQAGCVSCHPPALFTDLGQYEVGTAPHRESSHLEIDTPSLVELWRTAPYLHDGSAATLHEVIGPRNVQDRHGSTSHLNSTQKDDLVAYLLSL